MSWAADRYAIEVVNAPCYTFGSPDVVRRFEREYLLEPSYRPLSIHGVVCSEGEVSRASAVIGDCGGGTAVHESSCLLVAERCLVAVGGSVVCLALPDLTLLWRRDAGGTCFGLYLGPDETCLVHGELEITKLTLDGNREWRYAGRDIFTGSFCLAEGVVEVTDFNRERYIIDTANGAGRSIGS